MSKNSSNFLQSINAFVDNAKANSELVVKKGCIEVLQDIIRMSPVGQPELWAINQTAVAYNTAVSDYNSSLRDNPDNLTRNGRLKKGLKVHDSMDIKKRAMFPVYTGINRSQFCFGFCLNNVPCIHRDKPENNQPKNEIE